MKIELTNEQYEKLLRLMYLGEWMVNAHDPERSPGEFDEVFNYILSKAKDAGLDNYVTFDESSGKYLPGSEFEDQNYKFVEEYDDNMFWEQLSARLAERDLIAQHGAEALKNMNFEERMDKESPLIDKYYSEFEKRGLQNISINGDTISK